MKIKNISRISEFDTEFGSLGKNEQSSGLTKRLAALLTAVSLYSVLVGVTTPAQVSAAPIHDAAVAPCIKAAVDEQNEITRIRALRAAAMNGELAAPTQFSPVDEQDEIKGTRAFIAAVMNGNIVAIKQSIADGVDVNRPERWGCRAITSAAERGYRECVQALLSAGATVNDDYLAGDSEGAKLIKEIIKDNQKKSARK